MNSTNLASTATEIDWPSISRKKPDSVRSKQAAEVRTRSAKRRKRVRVRAAKQGHNNRRQRDRESERQIKAELAEERRLLEIRLVRVGLLKKRPEHMQKMADARVKAAQEKSGPKRSPKQLAKDAMMSGRMKQFWIDKRLREGEEAELARTAHSLIDLCAMKKTMVTSATNHIDCDVSSRNCGFRRSAPGF
jgi:hypothetical protein